MLLNVSTDNLYDPIIALYEALFRGEREHTLRITLRTARHRAMRHWRTAGSASRMRQAL